MLPGFAAFLSFSLCFSFDSCFLSLFQFRYRNWIIAYTSNGNIRYYDCCGLSVPSAECIFSLHIEIVFVSPRSISLQLKTNNLLYWTWYSCLSVVVIFYIQSKNCKLHLTFRALNCFFISSLFLFWSETKKPVQLKCLFMVVYSKMSCCFCHCRRRRRSQLCQIRSVIATFERFFQIFYLKKWPECI